MGSPVRSRGLRDGFLLTIILLVIADSDSVMFLFKADFSSSPMDIGSKRFSWFGSRGRCFSLILPKIFLRSHDSSSLREATSLSREEIFSSLTDSSFSRDSIFFRSASCCSAVSIFLLSYYDVKIHKNNDTDNS